MRRWQGEGSDRRVPKKPRFLPGFFYALMLFLTFICVQCS
jgi:hypothetical protein